jgi:hypothetical protein
VFTNAAPDDDTTRMTQMTSFLPRLAVAAALALRATPAPALQAAPTSTPTPTPTPLPGSLGNLGGFNLPASGAQSAPPPPVPVVVPTPSPTPTPRAEQPRPTPTPAPSPTPRAAPTAQPSTTLATPPIPAAAPVAPTSIPSSTPTSAPAPAPSATPAPNVEPAEAERGGAGLWWLAALVMIASGVIAAYLLRRRTTLRLPAPSVEPASPPEPAPPPYVPPAATPRVPAAPLPPPVAPIAPATETHRPGIQIELRPVRAGLTMISALVEGELTVANDGTTPIERIALATGLVGAHRDGDAELAAFLAQPIGRPAVPPFALAPGETRQVRIVAPLARAAIRPMDAAGRPIFVPIVAVACRFVSDGDEFRAARAFAVGVERVDSAKLAPIWLDVPPRMFDTLAARPHPLPAGAL